MRISQKGIELIKEYEGCSLTAYPDPGSKNGEPWTIGVGHTGGIKKGDKITKEQADNLLREDIREREQALTLSLKGLDINQNEFDALLSLVFNIGLDAFNKSTIKRMLLKGDKGAAANAFGMWVKNDGKVLKGLVRRRAAEKSLFLTPDKSDTGGIEEIKIESATIPQTTDKPLVNSKEIGAGIALGGSAIVQTISNLNTDDLVSAQQGLKDVKTEVGTPAPHNHLGNYVIQGFSVLIFFIGIYIVWKRIKDRKEGKR